MLVLTHEVGQRVLVGNTWVTILMAKNGKVRLGYEGKDPVVRENAKAKGTDRPVKSKVS